jgi:hypothetical protein
MTNSTGRSPRRRPGGPREDVSTWTELIELLGGLAIGPGIILGTLQAQEAVGRALIVSLAFGVVMTGVGFSIATAALRGILRRAKRPRLRDRVTSLPLAVGVGSMLLVSVVLVGSARPQLRPPSPRVTSDQTAQPSSPTPAPPSGLPISSTGGCPLPDPTDPSLPSVEVKVIYWCKGDVFTSDGQVDPKNFQIKLRPRLVNNTASPVSIYIKNPSTLRLLVTGKQIDQRWSPPPRTTKAGDRPILVVCNGATFWAIPPNVPNDATLAGSAGYYTGFVTWGWDGVTLGPGSAYFKPLRHNPNGTPVYEEDLVFQVPLDDDGQARIYGLALLDPQRGNSLLGVALFGNSEQWGEQLAPTAF